MLGTLIADAGNVDAGALKRSRGTSAFLDRILGSGPDSRSTIVRLLGLAFLWAWVYLSFTSLKLLPAAARLSDLAQFTELSLAVNACVVFAAALLARNLAPLRDRRAIRFGSPVVMCGGTLLAALAWNVSGPEQLLFLVSATMTGVGSAGLWLCWGEAYTGVNPRASALLTPSSMALGVMLYVGLVALPAMGALIVGALLPFLSALVLPTTKHDTQSAGPTAARGADAAAAHPLKPLIRLGALICAYAAAYGLTRGIGIQAFGRGEQSVGENLLLLAVAVVFLLFVVVASASDRIRWSSGYRVALPVVLAGLLIVPSLGSGYSALAATTVRAGYTYFEMLVWITCSEIGYRYGLPAFRTFGIGRGAISAGQFMGMALGWLLATRLSLPVSSLATAELAIVLLLVVVSMVFLGNRDALDSLGFEDVLPAEALLDTQSEHKQRNWLARCDVVAQRQRLTPREREIMIMLAKGRNIPFIQKELVVSSGTVRTHVRNLYKKLAVHDRQELISLIEQCPLEKTEWQ